jgi:FMN phosphatase YigB (HAD superfamily)
MASADDNRKVGFSTLTGLQRLVGLYGARVFDPEMASTILIMDEMRRMDEKENDSGAQKTEQKEVQKEVQKEENLKSKKGDFPTSVDTIVFDFDGTLTDTWKGAKPFIAGYKEDLKAILGEYRNINHDFEHLWNRLGNDLFSYAKKADWIYEGNAVSSALGDPYLECNAIASAFFNWLSLFPEEVERSAVLQKLYTDNYPKTITVFREDAAQSLELAAHLNVCIATNSDTARVREKLALLNHEEQTHEGAQMDYSTLPLFGNAQKYKIDKEWQVVPEHLEAEDLHRPVLLRRRSYFEVLEKIRSTCSTEFSRMFVIGDNYELDLALPQALGMAVGYIETNRRMAYERKAVERYERGYVMEM